MAKQSSKPRVLLVFSNPADSGRLRLDREHRTIDEIQRNHNAGGYFLTLSAATIEDVVQALKDPHLQIVHFSGHGSPHGVYLEESLTGKRSVQLSAEKLTELVRSLAPQIQALILTSCYSASSNDILRHAAPYVITVEGPADDEAAIKFTKLFYEDFLGTKSIEASLTRTQIELQSLDYDKGLQIYVTRRAESMLKDRIMLQSVKSRFAQDTLLIDVTDVDSQIEELDMPKGEFLALLANKIYLHSWLPFSSSDMEYAVFPIGKYFAIFSWKHGMDVLVCRRILRPKSSATEKQCELWMSLSFRYSELFSLKYRRERQTIYAGMNQKLEFAIILFGNVVRHFFKDEETVLELRRVIPDQIKMAIPLISENYAAAERNFEVEQYSQVIVHLETTLSLIHGVLDGLVDELAL